MVKKGKLRAALDAHRGTDFERERQKKLAKQAQKHKGTDSSGDVHTIQTIQVVKTIPLRKKGSHAKLSATDVEAALEDMDDEISGDSDEEEEVNGVSLGDAGDDLSSDDDGDGDDSGDNGQEEEDDDEEEEEEEDIPMSDIEELDPEDREDIIPHQRLTINNTAALLKAHKSFTLSKDLPFSAAQVVTSSAQIEIEDVNDDLQRELAFYSQCLNAAVEGRSQLNKEGVPFSRPTDYFAEMVKTDEHMGRVKARMVEQAANKKAAAEARKQRDLKKFGKQVQVAKLQERDRQKRETLDRISLLKRKRKDAGGSGGATNEEDMFDVALDNEAQAGGRSSDRRGDGGNKRAKRDSKFGFGGKKRFSKSNDAASSGDMRSFSAKKMKAGGGAKKGKTFRPGKSKRAKAF